jgi:hypothetical protein
MPFGEYIKHSEDSRAGTEIALPAYASVPGFTWNLKVLLKPEHKDEVCILEPGSSTSVQATRERLRQIGKLDPR